MHESTRSVVLTVKKDRGVGFLVYPFYRIVHSSLDSSIISINSCVKTTRDILDISVRSPSLKLPSAFLIAI